MEALANGRAGKKLDAKTLKKLREIALLRSQLLQKISKLRGKKRSVEECLKLPGTVKGRIQLRRALRATPFPRYEPALNRPGILIRTEADGTRKRGRFIGRKFKIVPEA
jgi:hypothetical protein